MKAILLVSHGSRSPKTKREVEDLVKDLKKKTNADIFDFAFLELERPSIPEGIENCVQRGATSIIILLNFLNSGRHVDDDIPKIVQDARDKFPQVAFTVSKPLCHSQKIVDTFQDLLSKVSHARS